MKHRPNERTKNLEHRFHETHATKRCYGLSRHFGRMPIDISTQSVISSSVTDCVGRSLPFLD